MLYTFLVLTALLSLLQKSDGIAAVASGQTRSMANRGSIAALNNLVVLGCGSCQTDGDVSFAMFTYATTGPDNLAALSLGHVVDDFIEALDGTAANTVTSAVSGDLAGNTFLGLGHAVAIADMSTVFVSQTSVSAQTGRVVVYEGNVTTFSQKQLLIPYDGKHRQDSAAAFGESIAAKPNTLAVGCQNCNSSAPVFSGSVYVYKSNKEGRWSESQVLTVDGVLFLGEQVAMHENVIVAAGDDKNTFTQAQSSNHDFSNVANTVVIFEEKGPKFEQRQVIVMKSGGAREEISGVTVFDETIAITTKGSDVGATFTQRDKVYIYYPMNKRYGLEPKGKPSPQQWTNIQVLTSPSALDVRYDGAPLTSISGNLLRYVTTTPTTKNAFATSTRECMSCKFSAPVVVANNEASTDDRVLLAADSSAFYSFSAHTAETIDDPQLKYVAEPNLDGCLNIKIMDQYNDGWGIASLVVTSPTGREDKYTLQCTSQNPMLFKYCPNSNAPGKYHIHVENGEETPFGWEINYQVSLKSTWYAGDRHTHMDFLWDEKYESFVFDDAKGLLPQADTCKVCNPNAPTGKRRSLSNLRSLSHKGKTSSPTMTLAPTLTSSSLSGLQWNEFVIAAAANKWFSAVAGQGSKFMISDVKGKKLLRSGTGCSTSATTCWIDLPDGDYNIRVGSGISNPAHAAAKTWTFCGANAIDQEAEFDFSIVNQECYLGLFHRAESTCLNTYKSDFYLNVDLVLSGGATALSTSDESALGVALQETMLSVVGSLPASSKITKQVLTSSGVEVSVVLKFESSPDITALDNFVMDTTSASSLLKYELIGTQALAAKFLEGGVSSVAILSASSVGIANDFSNVDESSFQTVTDHAWTTASSEKASNNFNEYAEYIAEGAYALVAVAAVLAVSLFVKRAMNSQHAVVAEISEVTVSAPSKPVFVAASLDEMEASSEDSGSDQESDSEKAVAVNNRVNLASAPKRTIDVAQMKQLIHDEDEVFKSFLNKSRK